MYMCVHFFYAFLSKVRGLVRSGGVLLVHRRLRAQLRPSQCDGQCESGKKRFLLQSLFHPELGCTLGKRNQVINRNINSVNNNNEDEDENDD